jgi:hypothetical protein
MLGQIEQRITELLAICRGFQIKIYAVPGCRDCMGESGFASLARAEQGNRGEMAKPFLDKGLEAAGDHLCNYGIAFQICKVKTAY